MAVQKKHSFRDLVSALKQKPFLIAFLMGFSSGLPFLLTSKTMQVWLKESSVDLTLIGIFAFVGLPYTLKFVWSPLVDRYKFPFLGLRRGWILVSQIVIALMILFMAMIDPQTNLWWFAIAAMLIAFFSSTQDIVVDAYRIETLKAEDLGMGTALYMYGYKIAMLISGALALILADHMSWRSVYFIMAVFMGVSVVITLWAEEPEVKTVHPHSLKEAIFNPFVEFFSRKFAFLILIFIILYKVGDNMAGSMLSPFYLDMGYTKTEIGVIAKAIAPTIGWIGPVLGGFLVYFFGIMGALWIAGFLQAASTFCFVVLAWVPKNLFLYGAVISFEDVTAAVGSIAFVAFMSNSVNRKFTATQYALLSSLAQVPRVFIAMPTGYLAKTMGWPNFFIFCALAAIPGMLLLFLFRQTKTA